MTECKIGFIDTKVREAYYDLKGGYSDEKQLFILISQAIENIKKNNICELLQDVCLFSKNGMNELKHAIAILKSSR